mmetsp:Transcript_11201/g.12322  ORF Transcript_11201/g.12322 Transcript_11201/m.12322 type:complete len:134 (-) Transcript_11201:193-594(-)
MGGHGALIIGLKTNTFKSVSAFAPISNPVNCPWGEKCFGGYLGSNKEDWKAYDATELIKSYKREGDALPILVDQGTVDGFLGKKQLLPENLTAAAKGNTNVALDVRMQDGYDHSYFFISTFIQEHIEFHMKYL